MKFFFEKSYMCCNCSQRKYKSEIKHIYKKFCLCKECADLLSRTPPKSTFAGTRNVDFVSSAFYYDGVYRNLFLGYKFSSIFANGHIIAKELKEYYEEFDGLSEFDYIVPVPLSKKRLNERGYNQSELFADYISEALNVPVISALKRNKSGLPQSKLAGMERVENVRDAFEAICDLSGRNIIIVDDVFTTGNTLEQCAKALKQAGADKICGITAAYTSHKAKQRLF